MFLMFGSLDERVDVSIHPRFIIIFNDVSRYGDKYDPLRIKNDPSYDPMDENPGLSKEQRINDIKSQIKDKAKRFYLSDKISDDTQIGSLVWKDIKDRVCASEAFETESWYIQLMDHQ